MRTNKVQKEDSNENNYQRYGGGMRVVEQKNKKSHLERR